MLASPIMSMNDEEQSQKAVPGFARRHEVLQLSQTSVPHWESAEVAVPRAASFLMLAFGDDGEARAKNLVAGATVPVTLLRSESAWDDSFSADLEAAVTDQLVGVRIVTVGPENDVYRAASLLSTLGAVTEEVVLVSTDVAEGYLAKNGHRRVFCGFCHTTQEVEAGIGDSITCVNCEAGLTIHYHFSRPKAAYLGVPNGSELDL